MTETSESGENNYKKEIDDYIEIAQKRLQAVGEENFGKKPDPTLKVLQERLNKTPAKT